MTIFDIHLHDYASEYLDGYEESDATVVYVDDYQEDAGAVLFGTSDGRHWLMDCNETYEVRFRAESIKWDDYEGYVVTSPDPVVTGDYWME